VRLLHAVLRRRHSLCLDRRAVTLGEACDRRGAYPVGLQGHVFRCRDGRPAAAAAQAIRVEGMQRSQHNVPIAPVQVFLYLNRKLYVAEGKESALTRYRAAGGLVYTVQAAGRCHQLVDHLDAHATQLSVKKASARSVEDD